MNTIDFRARLQAKAEEAAFLQSAIDDRLVAQQLLADAIEQMREILDDGEVAQLLRYALEVL